MRVLIADDQKSVGTSLAELNYPVADRIRQLELNLERWRWIPRR
jgi:murein L,D-transpeptidase YcbB/YkuD